MNICILSNVGGNPDEGIKNVAVKIAEGLSKNNNVLHVNARKIIFSFKFWKQLVAFTPQVIHIILRPNLQRFIVGKLICLKFRKTKLVISALQPPLNQKLFKLFIPFFKSDMVLPLSLKTEAFFQKSGCKTAFIGCGVDTNKFRPVSQIKKEALRAKFKIEKNKFVILHVGHLSTGRNIEQLIPLHGNNEVQVVIVGSPLFEADQSLIKKLTLAECTVLIKFFPDIEELYQMADCYFFPTENESFCIEIPLSVMEAMACNLPIITTRFGALPRMFSEGNGLNYIDNTTSVKTVIEQIKMGKMNVMTREKIKDFTWKKVISKLEIVYQDTFSQG